MHSTRWVAGIGILAALAAGVGTAGAESVGSPASVLEKGRWTMTAAVESVLGRATDGAGEISVIGGGHARGYGLTEWLSVYGMFGGAYVEAEDPTIVIPNDPTTSHSFGGNFFTSAQLKARLLQRGAWEWDGSTRYIDIRGGGKGKNQARWHHWMLSTSVAKAMGRATPYAGVHVSILRMHYKVRDQGQIIRQGRYRQDRPVGAFLGTDVYFGEDRSVVLNLEGAYLDGPEAHASISYVF